MNKLKIDPPDREQRDLIITRLDKSMLVEAAAGTGKTTSMIQRMTALLETGRCPISKLAAVTFTRKSAAELRSRFQIELESRCRNAPERNKHSLEEASSQVDRCFIGTIHSFCARLLRERPVEAKVDLSFEEIDESTDLRLVRQAWNEHVTRLHATNDPILKKLGGLGIQIGDLAPAFHRLANYPDVEAWPCDQSPMPDFKEARETLLEFVDHMEEVKQHFPHNYLDYDDLMRKISRVSRLVRHKDLDHPADLVSIMESFTTASPKPEKWLYCDKKLPKLEKEQWMQYRAAFQPHIIAWRKYCYPACLAAIRPALEVYNRLRTESAMLNYQDLLMKAADLLRDKSNIREYFRKRFSHLLVDEFQDTDPIQAEVMMFLTARDPAQTDWKQCQPVDGSLFVVGDPKQSIYRFRRADIVTYNKVKEIIVDSGGLLVTLQANFRTVPPLIGWINKSFEKQFPESPSPQAPVYVPLLPGRPGGGQEDDDHLRCLRIGKEVVDIREHEAVTIARTIDDAIRNKLTLVTQSGLPRAVEPGDFLVVAHYKKNLGIFASKLEELRIPHAVVGGNSMNQLRELSLLHMCLCAVTRPHDPVALVAVLRSEVFGISDSALYEFKRAKGAFSFRSEIPSELDTTDRDALSDAFSRLRDYSTWLRRLPVISAIEKISADLGLSVMAACSPGGNVRAGSFGKALELLRTSMVETWTISDLVAYLGQLVQSQEQHDGIPALPHQGSAVQVMNLHKVKGLEAPIVFLVDATGENRSNKTVEINIDRSGDKVMGYMAMQAPSAGFVRPTIALPSDWESREAEEKKFEDGEAKRLYYVAATRAGSRLIISQREKYNNRNPWNFFDKYLKDAQQLTGPPHGLQLAETPLELDDRAVREALESIPNLWGTITAPTYDVASAKMISSTGALARSSGGEHGTEWGSAIHRVLQATLVNPTADLSGLAVSALAEQGLEMDLAHDAVDTVRSVMASEIWKRALEARRKYVEIPFQRLIETDSADIILRGVIDLVFLEEAGWVIVDYKTDRFSGPLDELVEKYKPQVLTYTRAWAEMTGEPVIESGLYFTFTGRYSICEQQSGL
ncbi:MAG: UvrD-helicase domain-containing protein [Desulfomonile tiedjei]|uniref:DNA 3'-5' helicase n=1 Tax=Desulfomonile tiedjei TaxID=2358 RepID=A0A9D6V1C0_9BACT|nr:UvrD-helicase domain-containing protein [Desulfomonile tiedjei]